MKRSTPIQLSIPTPCTESWAGMTPQNGGRHCAQCSKVVTDFTVMTDRELAAFFKDYKGGGCGRFATEQLERAIIPPAESPHPFWMRVLVGVAVFVGMGNASFAQKKKGVKANNGILQRKPRHSANHKVHLLAGVEVKSVKRCIVGALIVAPVIPLPLPYAEPASVNSDSASKSVKISGCIYDEKGEKMPGALIKISGLSQSAVTNKDGEFSLDFPAPLQDRNDTLLVRTMYYSVRVNPTDEELAGLKKIEICLPASAKHQLLGMYISIKKRTPWQRFKHRVHRLFR